MSEARVYGKTQAGVEEIQQRQAGLNARVRQLLILVDGKRSVSELGRMMAVVELEEFLALLELKGLITVRGTEGASPSSNAPHRGESGLHSPSSFGDQDRYSNVVQQESHQVVADVALAPHASNSLTASGAKVANPARFKADRANLSQLLQETVGPMSNDLCIRVERATRPAELAELFVASLTVVELMSGRKAADKFVEKMKHLGWEE
jgi:hypothetical protein